jgi:hypothetical protein
MRHDESRAGAKRIALVAEAEVIIEHTSVCASSPPTVPSMPHTEFRYSCTRITFAPTCTSDKRPVRTTNY